MTTQEVIRDERTIAVENASFRWSYRVMSFGLLLAVAYRSFVRGESAWDLLGLVILAGGVNAAYQRAGGIFEWRIARLAVVSALAAAILALAIVLLRTAGH